MSYHITSFFILSHYITIYHIKLYYIKLCFIILYYRSQNLDMSWLYKSQLHTSVLDLNPPNALPFHCLPVTS